MPISKTNQEREHAKNAERCHDERERSEHAEKSHRKALRRDGFPQHVVHHLLRTGLLPRVPVARKLPRTARP